MDQQLFLSHRDSLRGTWNGFGQAQDDPAAAISFEACLGTTPYGCQASPMARVDGGKWSADDLQLRCGEEYFLTVRATNCAGLARSAVSKGARLCCDPPVVGTVQLVDAQGEPVRYVGNEMMDGLAASWQGFADTCSGMLKYAVSIRSEEAALVWTQTVTTNDTWHLLLPSEVLRALPSDATFSLVVEAHSRAGLVSEMSAPFTVDRTPPTLTRVFGEDDSGSTCLTQPRIIVNWHGLKDDASGLLFAECGVGRSPDMADLINETIVPRSSDSCIFTPATPLAVGMRIFHILRASDRAGNMATFASTGMLVVRGTDYNAGTLACPATLT